MIFPIFPPAASRHAQQVDALFTYLMTLCGLFLTGIVFVMTWWLIKYRRGKPALRRRRTISSTPFEITWSIIPLFIFLSFFVWGARLYYQEEVAPDNTMEIHVVAKQWMWKIQHPEGNREINELHVPVGRAVKLEMATEDVIHSFFLPAFRIKQDVVPGRYTTEWFTATRIGNFPIFCAEYCGTEHSFMGGRVIVMTPQDYETWLEQTKPPEALADSGRRLFRNLGCGGCHENTGIVRAPALRGLYRNPVPLQNGQVVTADDAFIHDAILNPKQRIAAGFPAVMPSFRNQVNEEQVFELIAYIKSLPAVIPSPARPMPGEPE